MEQAITSSHRPTTTTTTINGVVVEPVGVNNNNKVRREFSFNNNSKTRHLPQEKGRTKGAMQKVEYYNNGNAMPASNNNNNSSTTRETYKALGDVYGQQQLSNHVFESKKQLGKNISMPMNGHLFNGGQVRPARSMSSMVQQIQPGDQASNYKHVPLTRNNHVQHQSGQRVHYPRVVPSQRFGNPDTRASYSERYNRNQNHQPFTSQLSQQHRSLSTKIMGNQGSFGVYHNERSDSVYKSNGSLDLDHEVEMVQEVMNTVTNSNHHGSSTGHYQREFGSHGSIDVITRQEQNQNQLFPDIHSFDSNSMDGVTIGGPAAVSTLQRKPELNRSEESGMASVVSSGSLDDSPKQRKKVGGFFSSKEKDSSGGKGNKSLFKKLRVGSSAKDHESSQVVSKSSDGSDSGPVLDRHAEDRHRRRFFSHYDIGSVCASLSITTHLKTLERRNTTTGASAASAALRNTENAFGTDAEKDQGDNVSNELVLSCPYFRNEIGGEDERKIALTRQSSDRKSFSSSQNAESCSSDLHIPGLGKGFSLLDTNETFWKQGICPYTKVQTNVIEKTDDGSLFYKKYFYGKDHQNWFGHDENLGPVAISIRREKVLPSGTDLTSLNGGHHSPLSSSVSLGPSFTSMDSSNSLLDKDQFMYRLLIRTSELMPLRGCVLEDAIPSLKSEKIKSMPTKEVLEFVAPELQLSSLHQGLQSGPCEEELLRLDEAYVQNKYKVGLMYCKEGQQTEEEMYNNEEGGAAFNEFLDLIGNRVRLLGFNKYKAGLCNKNDSTGLYSIYKEFEGNEIMFHVSTLLPFTPNNRQQLPRKRYIGNDIVTVVFQEPGAQPFIPNIKSQFQHVFIVVRAHNPCSENTQYSVAVTRSKSVPMFGPPLPKGGRFAKSKSFADFLLTKIINAERAAHKSDKFVSMAVRTRQELLKDLATNHITQTSLETGSKFSLFGKKKDKMRPRFSPNSSCLKGALSWRIVVEDCAKSSQPGVDVVNGGRKYPNAHNQQPPVVFPSELDAFIAISHDTLVVIQDNLHHDVLFITPTKSLIGWTASPNSIRIYFHQGEALIIHSKDWETEDMSEISQRLKSVTNGAATQEFTLRRNQLGQLGFHVQHDGLITEVENFGYAWQTGLRQGSRLVEINKHPVTALSHEQMVELLKTSMTVTVTVIPPMPDGTPRMGCHLKSCPYAFGSPTSNSDIDGDYENLNGTNSTANDNMSTASIRVNLSPKGQKPSASKTKLESNVTRSISPPSYPGNSSGYGTDSSSRRDSSQQSRITRPVQQHIGDQITENRWYEMSDQHASSSNENSPPPPVPTRVIGSGTNSAFQKVSNSSGHNTVYQHLPMNRGQVRGQHQHAVVTTSNYSSPSNFANGFEPKQSAMITLGPSNNLESKQKRISPNYSSNQPKHGALEEKRSGEAKVTYLTEYELNQPRTNKEYLQHERLTALKPSLTNDGGNKAKGSLSMYVIDAGHNTDSSTNSDRNLSRIPHQSEDEFSEGSNGVSPHRRRRSNVPLVSHRGPPSSASSSGSRNESPRTVSKPNEENSSVVKKRQIARNPQHRNSANLASSTLQEDLLKLIGPEFDKQIPKSKNQNSVNHTTSVSIGSRGSNLTRQNYHLSDIDLMRSRSRENISRLSESLVPNNSHQNVAGVQNSDGISESSFHMARPATVISNNSSMLSSPPSANTTNRSPKTNRTPESSMPLPDDRVMDWNALVDTANKAIKTNNDGNPVKTSKEERKLKSSSTILLNENKEFSNDKKSSGSEMASSPSSSISASPCPSPASSSNPKMNEQMGQLLEKVSQLETRLNSESKQKSHLEEEVAALREENLRLQEESQTASQQLKRFTEWFFQTIDKN